MPYPTLQKRPVLHSFSLIELLVVMAIASVLAVISISAFTQVTRAAALSTGTQIIKGELDFARQTAITRNSSVEFRLYQMPDASGSFKNYAAFQTFLITSAGTNALTKVSYFPQLVGVSTNSALTSLTSLGSVTGATLNQPLPIYKQNYNALTFRFSSKGSLQLDVTKQWFATLVMLNDPLKANGLPNNFSVIQMDPVTGQTSIYRP